MDGSKKWGAMKLTGFKKEKLMRIMTYLLSALLFLPSISLAIDEDLLPTEEVLSSEVLLDSIGYFDSCNNLPVCGGACYLVIDIPLSDSTDGCLFAAAGICKTGILGGCICSDLHRNVPRVCVNLLV